MAAFHVFLVDEEDEEAEEDEKIKEEIINEESAEDPLLITAEEGKEKHLSSAHRADNYIWRRDTQSNL